VFNPGFSFLKGIAIGLFFAVPVGPIGVLCIRRSIAHGFQSGLATGLGAATADAIFGGIAAFGLTTISSFLVGQTFWLGLVGGLLLCYLGFGTFLSKPKERDFDPRAAGLNGIYFSTLVLTITNPMSILLFAAAFAGFGIADSRGYFGATALVLGIFAGSTIWWLVLSGGVSYFRSRFDLKQIKWVNRLSGAVICLFGIYTLQRLVR
jgi:threonine/homoserine/homoserine lactone efflux protein